MNNDVLTTFISYQRALRIGACIFPVECTLIDSVLQLLLYTFKMSHVNVIPPVPDLCQSVLQLEMSRDWGSVIVLQFYLKIAGG